MTPEQAEEQAEQFRANEAAKYQNAGRKGPAAEGGNQAGGGAAPGGGAANN